MAAQPSKPTQLAFIDWLKPRRGVAISRIKNNGFAMVVVLLVTQLLPITPSPLTCLWMLLGGGGNMRSATRWMCWLELAVFTVLSLNILQAYIGLKYPPPHCQPLESPVKRAQVQSPPPARPLKLGTPLRSSMSLHASISASSYAPSPISTPSRIINYKPPTTGSPFNNSLNSSTFSNSSVLLSSPLAYRARHSSSVVRPLDGSLLNQLEAEDDDEY